MVLRRLKRRENCACICLSPRYIKIMAKKQLNLLLKGRKATVVMPLECFWGQACGLKGYFLTVLFNP